MYHHNKENEPDKEDRQDRIKIEIDRDKEMRTEGISQMIDEGGLGAFNYYDVTKESSSESKEKTDEPKTSQDNDKDN